MGLALNPCLICINDMLVPSILFDGFMFATSWLYGCNIKHFFGTDRCNMVAAKLRPGRDMHLMCLY